MWACFLPWYSRNRLVWDGFDTVATQSGLVDDTTDKATQSGLVDDITDTATQSGLVDAVTDMVQKHKQNCHTDCT